MGVFEVETKFGVTEAQVQKAIKRLMNRGGTKTQSVTQEDIYYDHPMRAFAETDEALRIRYQLPETEEKRNDTPVIELTYKGPKVDEKSKTRLELSVNIDSRERSEAILLALGFKRVRTVRKEREYYRLGEIHFSVDRVEGLGLFIELETEVRQESRIEEKRNLLLELAENLGLDMDKSTRLSYLEMLISQEY
jgi:adenylate cyclase class 2